MKYVVVIGLLLCGCAHLEPHQENVVAECVPAKTIQLEAPLCRAEQLEQQGRSKEAMELYAMLQASSQQFDEVEQARLGRARCMLRLEKPDAAIALLSDLPENPETVLEAQQMALVGEAFLRKGHAKPAESLFEVALSVSDVENQAWAAPASANLAVTYLKNNKPDKAYAMYRYASRLFRRAGDYSAGSECRKMAQQLCVQPSSRSQPEMNVSIPLKPGLINRKER